MTKWGYYFKRNSASSDIGYYYVMFPAIVVEEALFNRAEAYAMQNNTQAALSDINGYLSKRILNKTKNSVATLNNINEFYSELKVDYTLKPFYENEIKNRGLLNCIIDLRRKEFIYNGLRWFDIKRFNLPVTHKFIDGSVKELKSKDLRKAVQIPTSAQQYGIKSNPR